MAGELTKGLNILLHPKFTELCQRLDRLEVQHKDLTAVVALKEDRQEVDHLRDHVSSQIKHVDGIIAMNRDKMLSLDELRSREIRALAKSVEQKATLANLQHVSEQVQALTMTLPSKADTLKVDNMAKNMHAISDDVSQKATSARAEQLAKQLQVLSDSLAKKVDMEVIDKVSDRVKALAEDVSARADATKVMDLIRKLDTLAEEVAHKANLATVDVLSRQQQALSEDVEQRAELRKTEHLTRQLAHLQEEVALKAEHATSEQTVRHVHALSEAIAQKVESQAHNTLQEQVTKIREDLHLLKSEQSKLDEHSRQLEALQNGLSSTTSKVKHLSLMYASASGSVKGNTGELGGMTSPTLMSPLSPDLKRDKLPALGSPGASQKPGMVSLPGMAHPPQSARA